MATKANIKNKKKKLPQSASKGKRRQDRSTTVTQHAYDILEAAKKRGCKKIDFASEAIIAFAKVKLGDAMPASREDEVEARLDYLERIVSAMSWENMCKASLGQAKNLRRLVELAGHSPFSRNFKELNAQREAKGKATAGANDWITVAFAEKFGLPQPEQEQQ